MNVNIHQSWKTYLQPEFEKPYFKDLAYLNTLRSLYLLTLDSHE